MVQVFIIPITFLNLAQPFDKGSELHFEKREISDVNTINILLENEIKVLVKCLALHVETNI